MSRFKKSGVQIAIFMVVCIFWVLQGTNCAQGRKGGRQPGRRPVVSREVQQVSAELRDLIEEKQAEGVDVSEAKQLLQQSRAAMRAGRERQAIKLVRQGIEQLKKASPPQPETPVAEGPIAKGEMESTPGGATRTDFIYGLRLDPPDDRDISNMEKYFQLASELGMGYIKVAVVWAYVEPVDDRWTWQGDATLSRSNTPNARFDYDYVAELANKYNLSVVPMFLRTKQRGKDTDPAENAEYVHAFVSRYYEKMKIKYIEFQNEPNADNDGTGGGRHWNGTAADLARVNTAVYEKVKASYPDIMVGTAGFITGSRKMADMYTKSFLTAYFEAKPKFDVLMLHDYPKNMSYTQASDPNELSSQYYSFQLYRKLLDRYGYTNQPILVTEGNEEKQFTDDEAATHYAAGYCLTKAQSRQCNVIGKFISNGVFGRKCIALKDSRGNRTKQFTVVKNLIESLKSYPEYVGRVAGNVNSQKVWVEQFKSKAGQNAWFAFCPVLYTTADGLRPKDLTITSKKRQYPQDVTLEVGDVDMVKVTGIMDEKSQDKDPDNQKVDLVVSNQPVIVVGEYKE